LRVGVDVVLGPVTTGPVAGLVLQQAHINGFTETGASGVTALSFSAQTRNSAVSQLGWRALMHLGNWRPFLEAKWSHELADTNREVDATLTSVAVASYSMPAAPVAADWGTASLGTSYRISDRVMLRGAAVAVSANPQVVSYGGELGISVSF
ncbi:MAG: autotransporter domain-containing protein, partial [Syntrophales bacterium]|nr:autotransporter domain-containing protein [Syntrophales bacterium]